tara:strand:- start:57 stop:230 length:174 start_codon:yes stop_codon:yes gene_type:complete
LGERKKTKKLVKKILNDEKKCSLYTEGELQYMRMQLLAMKLEKARRKLEHKKNKGFG